MMKDLINRLKIMGNLIEIFSKINRLIMTMEITMMKVHNIHLTKRLINNIKSIKSLEKIIKKALIQTQLNLIPKL